MSFSGQATAAPAVARDAGAIDVWMQPPTREWQAQDYLAPVARWSKSRWTTLGASADDAVASMDRAGVGHGLLSAWYGPQGPIVANDQIAQWLRAFPDRFSGVAGVDLRRPADAVRDLRRVVRGDGFVALRMLPWLWEVPPTDARFYPLYVTCIELGIPFCTQVGHTGPLRPSETGRPIPYIDQIALDFPELVVVCGHIGYPWTEEMIAVARKHENVYIDTSAYTARRYPRELVNYMRSPRHKVMFGSNYPMLDATAALDGLGALGLDESSRERFLHGNARRAFPRLRPRGGLTLPEARVQ